MATDLQSAVLAYRRDPTALTARTLADAVRPYVARLAGRIALPSHPLASREELEIAGMIGVFEALERYDPTRGIPFAAYAQRRVLGALVAHLRTLDPLPRAARRDLARAGEEARRLEAVTARVPSPDAVAKAAGLDVRRLADLRAAASLRYGPPATDGDLTDPVLLVPSDADSSAEAVRRDLAHHLGVAIDGLDERSRQVVRLYYFGGLTQAQVADQLLVSTPTVAKMLDRALQTLREHLEDTTPLQSAA